MLTKTMLHSKTGYLPNVRKFAKPDHLTQWEIDMLSRLA